MSEKTYAFDYIPNYDRRVRGFILSAQDMRDQHMSCAKDCVQHLEDDGLKGIERQCMGGCMQNQYAAF